MYSNNAECHDILRVFDGVLAVAPGVGLQASACTGIDHQSGNAICLPAIDLFGGGDDEAWRGNRQARKSVLGRHVSSRREAEESVVMYIDISSAEGNVRRRRRYRHCGVGTR